MRLLVFNHMGPIAPDNWVLRKMFERGIGDVRPKSEWLLGYDGFTLDLPAGENQIIQGKIG